MASDNLAGSSKFLAPVTSPISNGNVAGYEKKVTADCRN